MSLASGVFKMSSQGEKARTLERQLRALTTRMAKELDCAGCWLKATCPLTGDCISVEDCADRFLMWSKEAARNEVKK